MEGVNFFLGVISLGRVEIPSPKKSETFPRLIRSFPVKENHTGSEVSEILRTDVQKILLLYIVGFCLTTVLGKYKYFNLFLGPNGVPVVTLQCRQKRFDINQETYSKIIKSMYSYFYQKSSS